MSKTSLALAEGLSAVDSAIAGGLPVGQLSEQDLVAACERLNSAYRRGEPEVDDQTYDHTFLTELRQRRPDHPFLHAPEPEPDDAFAGDRYRHTVPMLSTDKAYTQKEVDAWLSRVATAAEQVGVPSDSVRVRVTAKLDGIATYRYPDALVTRGRNGFGTNITRILSEGVVGGDVPGAGELVVELDYFERELAGPYDLEHPRNVMAGLAGAEEKKDYHQIALAAGAVRVIHYGQLPAIDVGLSDFGALWQDLMRECQQVPYLCDGAVAEVIDPAIRSEMGATSHHHRFMLALKENTEFRETDVTSIRLTTGRTGQVTPTAFVQPVPMYGVTISKATAHTCGHIASQGLGAGARIKITRGGGVIPKIVEVVRRSDEKIDLSKCPSCGGATEWDGAHLYCTEAATCPAQASRALEHFFKTLGVCNGFGPTVTSKLAQAGLTSPFQIYRAGVDGLLAAGISPGVAKNLQSELDRSRREPISDAVFLAAVGIRHLGRGDSRKVLAHVALEDLGGLTAELLSGIHGFGDITSPAIAASVRRTWPLLRSMLDLGFNLDRTPSVDAAKVDSPISGKTIVFTGAMQSGSREDMEVEARRLGATVGSSVTGKTHFLVCGERVGANKTEKATKLGVQVLTEAQYRGMLAC